MYLKSKKIVSLFVTASSRLCLYSSILSSGLVVKEDHLSILFTLNFSASAHSILLSRVQVRVNIDHLSITSVSEEETCVRVGINLEIWRVSVLDLLSFPWVVAQVSDLWLDLFPLREDKAEIFGFHSVGQVDICADLTLVALISYEQNRG